MVANKTGRYPVNQIINQFPANERAKVKEGIDALIEMSIFAIDGRDICITNRSEGLLQVVNHIVGKPTNDVEEMLKTSPAISSILASINSDIRFVPPSEVMPAATSVNDAPAATQVSEAAAMSIGNKIVMGIFLLVVFLGLMKLVFRY